MPLRTSALLSLALAALILPATAQASPYPVGSPEWDAAMSASMDRWGAMPCGGNVEYRWTSLPPGIVGYASWMQPAGDAPDPARFTACQVDLSTDIDVSPEFFCTVLAHELGHLHGREHVEDSSDLMSASLGDAIPECRAAMEPFRAAVPAAPAAGDQKVRKRKLRKTRRAKRGRTPRHVRSGVAQLRHRAAVDAVPAGAR